MRHPDEWAGFALGERASVDELPDRAGEIRFRRELLGVGKAKIGEDVGAPSSAPSGIAYDVSAATTDPNMINPVTWTWYVDGSYAGSTSTGQFSVVGGQPDSYQSIAVYANDNYGHQTYGSADVWICDSGVFIC